MNISKYGKSQWRVIVQHDGKRRSAVTKTKADAQRRGAELLLELGTTAPPNTISLKELLELHLEQSTFSVTTQADYQSLIRRLPGWLADWPITNITPHMVDRAYKRLTDEGWSAHRVNRLHNLMSPAFRRAQRWGWVVFNPTTAAERPAVLQAKKRVPSPADVRTLLAAAHETDPAIGCALLILATTGMRRGEMCALQWADIDAKACTINVQRAVSSTSIDAHRVTAGKTGEKGHRVIGVDTVTMAAIAAHRAAQAEILLARGQPRPAWVFTVDGVNPWRTDYVTHQFSDLRKTLGLEHVQLKNLRHFVATELLGAGVDIRTVSGRLGHASPKMTLDAYAAFLPARDQAAGDIMGRLTSG